jgi:hypothetical protein
MSKTYDNPDYEKWLSEQPVRKGNGLSISDTITQDIVDKKLYKVTKVDEDSSVWIYTVDFAVVKEEGA